MTKSSAPWDTLTAREQQVASSLACGMTNREIADQLSISIKTIDTHRMHVMKKLGTRNNVELLRFMLKAQKAAL
jgi:DNA-binding NarL/FixJ family response regulator